MLLVLLFSFILFFCFRTVHPYSGFSNPPVLNSARFVARYSTCKVSSVRGRSQNLQLKSQSVRKEDEEDLEIGQLDQFRYTAIFLSKAVVVGVLTGLSIVLFKSSIEATQVILYENLADFLPKPSFYWPLAIYPILGGIAVSILTYAVGPKISNGIDIIAQSIDSSAADLSSVALTVPGDFALSASPVALFRENYNISISEYSVSLENCTYPTSESESESESPPGRPLVEDSLTSLKDPKSDRLQKSLMKNMRFQPVYLFWRLVAAVATLGSGCSLGPEGPAVEIGTGLSRVVSEFTAADNALPYSAFTARRIARENRHLFLAGTAAGVAGGFNAPITGVFFAIEVGNRYLKKNTIRLDQDAPDGPRADIAAIVLAAAVSELIVGIGLHESQALSIQGNSYAMISPVFELTLYLGLGIISGTISVVFNKLRDIFAELYVGESWGSNLPFAKLPLYIRPILGGTACGIISVFFPQTLFVGYVTLDQLLSGGIQFPTPLILELLALKLTLTSFSICSGLGGGILAPALFFGAAAGTAYHDIVVGLISVIHDAFSGLIIPPPSGVEGVTSIVPFFSVAGAPAYATVGAAATLGALFRAPLTSSMLMFELTQNHDIVLPVLVSTGLGGLFAELISQPRRNW
jgi:H+/Cl- antiporter ClcA